MPPEDNKTNTDKQETNTENKFDKFGIQNIRTYKDDIQNVVKNENITSTRILLEEQRRQSSEASAKEYNSIKTKKNSVMLMISLVLIALAGGILGFIWFYPKAIPEPSKILINRPNFLEADGQTLISTELRNPRDIFSDVQRLLIANIQEDAIEEVILSRTEKKTVDDQIVSSYRPIVVEEIFKLLETRTPESFARSVDPEFMIGLYGTDTEVEPYLLFKIKDFENTFASMLDWEPSISRDMQPIFFSNLRQEDLSHSRFEEVAVEQIATSTSTTATTQVIEKQRLDFDPTIFKDRVVKNTDGRALINDSGEIVFFYTFINNEYLVFASSEKTLEEVIRRLRQSKLIR